MTTTTVATTETGTLQMVRARIDPREFHRWMGEKRLRDPDHAMHCLLAESFGDLAPKPFRLILPRSGPTGVFYGYGSNDADALRETAGIYADPLQSRVILVDEMDSKAMPSAWRVGQRLGFEVRLRPVVRRAREDADHRHREIDAFQAEAERYPKGEMPRSREQVYADWLSNRFTIQLSEDSVRRRGASLDLIQTKLVAVQRTRAYRSARDTRYSEGPDALMRGVLTITDAEAFAALLAKGVGRHRAYGFGMLLLRPA